SSRRRHTRSDRDWSSDVCSSDLERRDERLDKRLDVHKPSRNRTLQTRLVQSLHGIRPPERPELLGYRGRSGRALEQPPPAGEVRSEERRVGKEWRSRGWGGQ